MKILIVSCSDKIGGADRAAYRLHRALFESGIESQMLVQTKHGDDYNVITEQNKIKRMVNKFRPFLDSIPLIFYKKRKQIIISPAWLSSGSVVDKINKINPDIVHLHWINNGMLRIEDISKIKVPVIMSLHDMWTFTGGCHYTDDCISYKKKCGNCQALGSTNKNDLSRMIWNRKLKTFSKIQSLTIVCVSRWLEKCAKESSLLSQSNILRIPNPIDCKIYKPFDKINARKLWNLPLGKKLILFGALKATTDLRKGFKELSEALEKCKDSDSELVIFGSSKPENDNIFRLKTHYVGHLHDDISLVSLYSAVDVMVVPSLQEAFGQTASEAMSIGVPVVAFASTGLLDIIDHKKNGYLAKPFDTDDLAQGINYVLNSSDYDELCKNARMKVLKEFSYEKVANIYFNLYSSILDFKK